MALRFSGRGAVCAKPNCGHFDFLPMKCKHCGKMFCGAHISSNVHECEADDGMILQQASDAQRSNRSAPCEVCGKSIVAEMLIRCDRCGIACCVAHRHHDASTHPPKENPLVLKPPTPPSPRIVVHSDRRNRVTALGKWLNRIQLAAGSISTCRPALQAFCIVLLWLTVLWWCTA